MSTQSTSIEVAIYRLQYEGQETVDRAAQSIDRLAASEDAAGKALERQQELQEQATQNRKDYDAAVQRQIGSNRGLTESLVDTASNILSTVAHLKLLAVAAYAISPAFRTIVNAAIPTAIGAIGTSSAQAAGAMISRLTPALAFFTRLSIPIGVVVAAWEGLNAVINRGNMLLEKYAELARESDRSDLKGNLESLTKLQQDTISADQVRNAAELGQRLQQAKFTIDQFFKVQLDLTDPALKLQTLWVGIHEAIAKALQLLPTIPEKMGAAAQSIGNSSIWDRLNFGWRLPGALTPEQFIAQNRPQPAPSQEDMLAAARGRLGAGLGSANIDKDGAPLGGSFNARFGAAIDDLSNINNQTKAVKESSTEFDRLTRSLERSAAAQEADAKTVGQSVGEIARLRTESRLLESAQQSGLEVDGKVADQIKKIADRVGEAAQAFERARVNSQIKFDLQTIGLSDTDARVAQQLRGLYGDNVQRALASSEAAALRFNEQLKQTKELTNDIASTFASEFTSQLRQGASAWQAFSAAGLSALQRLEDRLIDMITKNLVNQAFGALGGGSGGGNLLSNLFGGNTANSGYNVTGLPEAAISAGSGHSGGIIGRSGGMRVVHPAYFDDAPRHHSGTSNLGADEVPFIGKRGEEIGWPDQLARKYGGAPVVNLNITNTAGADVQAGQPRQNGNGGVDIEVLIEKKVNSMVTSGRLDGANRQRYNLTPRGTRR